MRVLECQGEWRSGGARDEARCGGPWRRDPGDQTLLEQWVPPGRGRVAWSVAWSRSRWGKEAGYEGLDWAVVGTTRRWTFSGEGHRGPKKEGSVISDGRRGILGD